MTTAEPAVRKPTAKELADQALADIAQLRTELTELRDQARESGTVVITQTETVTPAQLDDLENRTADGFERLQTSVDQLKARVGEVVDGPAVVAIDPEAVSGPLAELETKVATSFKAYSKIVDDHNTAATQAIEELREQMPSVVDLARLVGELDEKVRLFDEAGVAPASEEDLSSIHNQVNNAHQRINAMAERVKQLGEYLESPTFAAVERTADAMAGARDGLVLGAAPRSGVPAVYGQMHELMKVVTELGKDKTADKKMGGYAFRSIEAAMDAVGRALREVGMMFQPREILEKRIERYDTTSKEGWVQHWTHVWVTQRYAFVSLIDGSEMSAIEMDGEARDNGDKSTSKADSMRLKYALLQALMIPVNGLPESDGRDGTEGGQVYGRGSAGDAFDNAAPERPQEEPSYQHGDAQHAVSGQQEAAAPPEDDRTPEEKAQAAYRALVALAGLEKPQQRPQLSRILHGIAAADIGHILITTADGRTPTLTQYATAVNAQVDA